MSIKEAFPEFAKPSIAVDTVILRTCDFGEASKRQVASKKLQVLLVKKDSENKWHLPGTIMRLGETSKAAISRIINDKSKINDTTFEQLYTVDNDLERDERGHIISIVYIGMHSNQNIDSKVGIVGEDYKSQWFWVNKDRSFVNSDTDELVTTLMYDHVDIINDTITRLKGKLLYTDVGFNFIGDKFTIRDLENTFVAINERQIPGFRRILASKIEGTGIMSDGKAYRPAELYKRATKEVVENE